LAHSNTPGAPRATQSMALSTTRGRLDVARNPAKPSEYGVPVTTDQITAYIQDAYSPRCCDLACLMTIETTDVFKNQAEQICGIIVAVSAGVCEDGRPADISGPGQPAGVRCKHRPFDLGRLRNNRGAWPSESGQSASQMCLARASCKRVEYRERPGPMRSANRPGSCPRDLRAPRHSREIPYLFLPGFACKRTNSPTLTICPRSGSREYANHLVRAERGAQMPRLGFPLTAAQASVQWHFPTSFS